MVGPCFSNGRVTWQCVMPLLTPLLKLGLVVPCSRLLLLRGNMHEFLCENVARHRAACLESSVKMNRRKHCFQRIGQQRVFLTPLRTVLPAPELEMLPQSEPAGCLRQRCLTHHLCFQLREGPF